MKKPRNIYKENTTLRTVLNSIGVFIAGAILIFLTDYLEWFKAHAGMQATVREIGAVLIASVALLLLWELSAKRSFARELQSEAKIAETVSRAGVTGVWFGDFNRDIHWQELFTSSKLLTLYVAYARTWRNVNRTYLEEIAKRSNAEVQIFLPNPEKPGVLSDMSDRFRMTQDEVRTTIEEAATDFIFIFEGAPAKFSLWYVDASPIYSFYVFEDKALITLHQHSRSKGKTPPVIMFNKKGSLWEFLNNEINALTTDDYPLAKQVYPIPENLRG